MCKSCASFLRVLVIIFNLFFIIAGVCFLSLGIFLFFTTYGTQGISEPKTLAYLYIGLSASGAIGIALGIFGCYGAYHYSKCLLAVYFTLLLILFAAEVPVGIIGFTDHDIIQDMIDSSLLAGMKDLRDHRDTLRGMDFIQNLFSCCGYNGPSDYGLSLPSSCCASGTCDSISSIASHTTGCKDQIGTFMQNWTYICASIICIALVQLFGLVLASILWCAIRNRDEGYFLGVQTA